MEGTIMQTQLLFEDEAIAKAPDKNEEAVLAETAEQPPKKKRGGYHGGHRPKTLPEGARRHSIWTTEEEFAELKGYLASYRQKAKEAVEC